MPISDQKLQQAQRMVGAAMSACLGLWFLPYVSGVICNKAEKTLLATLLKVLDCYTPAGVDSLFWFFRKKMLFLNAATYIPFAGAPLQIIETYGIGQFAINCAAQPDRLIDETWMQSSWKRIEAEIFSGAQVINAYQQFTGRQFPPEMRSRFVTTVDAASQAYRKVENIPGVSGTQEWLGESWRQGIRKTDRAVVDLWRRWRRR